MSKCDDGNRKGCSRRQCIPMLPEVTCKCKMYEDSEEDNTLARGLVITNAENIIARS